MLIPNGGAGYAAELLGSLAHQLLGDDRRRRVLCAVAEPQDTSLVPESLNCASLVLKIKVKSSSAVTVQIVNSSDCLLYEEGWDSIISFVQMNTVSSEPWQERGPTYAC